MSTLHEDAMALPPEPRWDNSDVSDFRLWLETNYARLAAYATELKAFAALPPGGFEEFYASIHDGQLFRSQQSAFNDAPAMLSRQSAMRTV